MSESKLRPGIQRINKKEINVKTVRNFILLGDSGCTGFDKESKKVLDKILRKKADLFFILGDLVCEGTKNEFREVIDFCNRRVSVPVFTLCGNHDMPDYRKALGSSSYAVISKNIVFICLNNSTAPFSRNELGFLEEELRKNKKKKSFIFFHVPPSTGLHASCMKSEEWQALKVIMDKYKSQIECIVAAHIHAFQDCRLDGYHIIITGGGGAKMYDLEKDTLKKHHAIKIGLENKNAVSYRVLPIEV
ncbi:MAG: metallophosphoesterase [Candidatus Omnitrophota bacterium]|nr:MAG: metallophosphoesterase [Candidatus Omnitrophota bacterium]